MPVDLLGVCVWTLILTHSALVCSEVHFLEVSEGDSVLLPCSLDRGQPAPYGVYLKRDWLKHDYQVLYKYEDSEFSASDDYRKRMTVSGDPRQFSVNVSISELTAGDTDRYVCDFIINQDVGEDVIRRGRHDFFILVHAAGPAAVDVRVVEVCPGASVTLPCLPPPGGAAAVEGVSLVRQKSQGAVEQLYHSKRHHDFPAGRVRMWSGPGPQGLTYNLTLQQLQPHDSALYSCHLLLQGRSHGSTGLGRQPVYVSVQGVGCSCSSYSILLYALSSAVVVLLVLLVGLLLLCRSKSRRNAKSHPAAPIYEEMTVVQPPGRKPGHLEEAQCSEYNNCPARRSGENHYEVPSGGPPRGALHGAPTH